MRFHHKLNLTVLAVAGLVTGSVGQLCAGEPGIVRIRDGAAAPIPTAAPAKPASAQRVSYAQPGCSSCNQPAATNCGQAGCGRPGCISCEGGGWRGLRSKSRSGCKKFCGFFKGGCCCHHGCNSADHGWGRPIKRPINRLPVLYQKYWPDAWAGQPGAGYASGNFNPAVYMPTDTTQLGYYYQQVPYWRPNPDMTPPVPWPSQWHQREYGAATDGLDFVLQGNGDVILDGNGNGFNGANGFGGAACTGPGCAIDSTPYSGQPDPVSPQAPGWNESPSVPSELAPTPAPAPPPPTTGLNESAQNVIP